MSLRWHATCPPLTFHALGLPRGREGRGVCLMQIPAPGKLGETVHKGGSRKVSW